MSLIRALPKTAIALALGALLASPQAKATPITGSISFDGIAMVNTGNLATATAYSSIFAFVAPAAETGTYAPVAGFTSVTFTPFSFAAPAVLPLWTFTVGATTYSFNASSIHVAEQNSQFLDIQGTGVANVTGFQSTAGTWSLTDTTVGNGPVFVFGASTMVAAVPDESSTLLLTAIGAGVLVGAVYSRRRPSKISPA